MNQSYRVIDTELTGEKAAEIFESVRGQLSDGMWENSKVSEHYYNFFKVRRDNDKVLLEVSTERSTVSGLEYDSRIHKYVSRWIPNRFWNMTDLDVKDWFAKKIKTIVKEEIPTGWQRTNHTELSYLGEKEKITVSDAYRVYDTLKGRSGKVY